MVKTRSSSFSVSSCPSSPLRMRSSLAPHKDKRRRHKKQVPIPPTRTDERGNRRSDSNSKSAFKNPSSHESRNPKCNRACKTVARKSKRCYKREPPPATHCSCKTSSKQAVATVVEVFSERNSNSLKGKRQVSSSRQASSMNVRISESAEACTKERSCDQLKEANHGDGWTSEQDMALQSAYFQVRPSLSFWFEVSKKVLGKTAKDCFDRFYSAHPTPPATQPRSKKLSTESPVRTISFASPLSSLKCKGRFGRGKQGLLKAHQTVRHILRQKKVADGTYEADVFSAVEQLNSKVSSLQNCISRAMSPLPALEGKDSESLNTTPATCSGYGKIGDEVWRSASSKRRTRSDHDQNQQLSRSASQIPILSPEVLKAERNPSRLDRFLDILHLRRVQKRKSSSFKGSSQGQEHLNSESRSTQCFAAAREAILTDVKDVLKTSLQQKLTVEEETSFSSDEMEDELSEQ